MSEVRLREKGQVTIPHDILQEWKIKNHVQTNDCIEAVLANGILMLIPKKRYTAKRDIMSFAGAGKGLWGNTPEEIDQNIIV